MTGTSGVVTRTLRALGARDPARERLRKMLSVTTGILLSVLWGHGVIHVLHADSGLLAMSVFLSLMSGLFVKDATAPARVVTTALLLPTLALVPILATLLQSQRLVLLAVFVLISGVAVWVRRFGSRATALGTLTFFAYFFTLFMHPDPEELPAFCLIAAGAAALARRRIDPPIDADAPGAAPPAEADASGTARPLPTTTTTSSTTPAESLSPGIGDPTVRAALIALARFTWVMHRLDEVLAPSEDRRPTRLRHHAL